MGLDVSRFLVFILSSDVGKKKKIHQAPSFILNQFLLDLFKSPYQIECFYTTRDQQTKKLLMKGISISK